MNTRNYMVIVKGEIKTSEVMSCIYNRDTQKWDVKFNNGKTYSYTYSNVEWIKEPKVLNPDMYRISREGRELFDIAAIYVFSSTYDSYWHICFGDGSERDYCQSDLKIAESCLSQWTIVKKWINRMGGVVVSKDMTYELAVREDIEEVYNVVQQTIKLIYPKYYPAEVVDFFCALHNEEAIVKDIESGYVSVLKVDGKIAGTGCFVENHITRVYVCPEYQKKGYGTFIVKSMEEELSLIHI